MQALDVVYGWAVTFNPWLQWFIAFAVGLGVIASHGGTRRIAIVIGIVTAILMVAAALIPGWAHQRMIWLTAANALAAIPLLVHPVTVRQQIVAATFLGLGVTHCIFAWVGVADIDVLKINWLISRLVDLVQAGLLTWWSWPHARERTYGFFHQAASYVAGRRHPVAPNTASVQASD